MSWLTGNNNIDDYSIPLIQYNSITGGGFGISVCAENRGLVYVKYNNIVSTEYYAINAGKLAVIEHNYIADCNRKTGVDTIGEQIGTNGSYLNPETSPISNAGCGW